MMNEREKACKKLAKQVVKEDVSKKELEDLKRDICRELELDSFPSNSEIMKYIDEEDKKKDLKLKPTRSISGVHVVAVMTSPKECPHGRCLPCPGGPDLDSPQSYTGKEPAARRAIRENYDPYRQVKNRINQLEEIGHRDVDKIELIIMGGTTPARDWEYLSWFVKRCLDAMNKEKSSTLNEAKEKNEDAEYRCVGLTFETRPDFCKKKEINKVLNLGGTRVELGVQTTSNEKYELIKRGHSVEDVVEATKLLKDSGLKVTYHMMPGLPKSSIKEDLDEFKEIFTDPRYKPDALKIYPTQVVEDTELYEKYRSDEYKALRNEETAHLIKEVMKIVPSYVRIKRVMRDIPTTEIIAGPDKSNMREIAWKKLRQEDEKCGCIRCREVGHRERKENIVPTEFKLIKKEINTLDTVEKFLSIEDTNKNILIGLLRLRKLHEPFRRELDIGDSMVRELHVYGPATPLGKDGDWQHRDFGKKLLKEAEKISKEEFESNKLHIISGIGARNYYRKFGYKKLGPYMSKELD